MSAAEIAVVGSVNRDLVLAVPHLPAPGETVLGAAGVVEQHGGKGANQAVAAARLGRRVAFVGRVGRDDAGRWLRDGLAAEGVDVTHLAADASAPSGMALIAVDPRGENSIIVSAGANACVGAGDVERAAATIGEAELVLLGHEVPEAAVAAAARAARGTVVLNPAPARAVDAEVLERVDVLVPNRGELVALAGRDGEPAELAAGLHRAVVVTLGAQGALVVAGGRAEHVPAPSVEAVDTTGAGDAFCGALAAALATGADLVEAARSAVAVAAASVTRPGARG